ncbi:hypothetical protein [Actinomadura madurae]|uniref:hypothetical protein n=1 Tax=Actinomadura madurae TaxID=1993 RepID=UPI0020D233FD|nr:hypothetical protein [Actinomadura madurae]MCQ0010400.1 hypothetical protein [Actinomadura madurae]
MSYDTLAAEARENDGLDGVRLAALGRARPLLDLLDGGRGPRRRSAGGSKGVRRTTPGPRSSP